MDAGFVGVVIAITGVTMGGIYLIGPAINQVGQLGAEQGTRSAPPNIYLPHRGVA
jgi:hypothetical protein